MKDFNESNATQAVIQSFEGCADPRLRQIMTSLVQHLHDFMREVQLTEEEWLAGIEFLTETGQMCSDVRQEFILLSDTLGASCLMDAINHRKPERATESTVLGPFYRPGAPEIDEGENIMRSKMSESVPCEVRGRVIGVDGEPISGALLDIWQTAPNALYEVQDSGQPDFNLRGKLKTGKDGSYRFATVQPVYYPIPHDGPVGKMLEALGRHPYRPAHIHFIVSAPGYEAVTTQIFDRADPYVDSDAVFGVRSSVLVDFPFDGNGGVVCDYDFVLAKAA